MDRRLHRPRHGRDDCAGTSASQERSGGWDNLYFAPGCVRLADVLVHRADLLATGLLGGWVRYTGTSVTEGLRFLVFFFAALGLAVLAASRTVRTQARQFVARNFYRSPYDYRAEMAGSHRSIRMTHSFEEILDQTLFLLSRTFGAPRLSIWMRSDIDGRFLQVRSVNLELPKTKIDPGHSLVTVLERTDYPVDLRSLSSVNRDLPDLLQATHAILGVPIRSGERLMAFILLSADPRKTSYGVDDCDLLKTIAHHVGVLLSHAGLPMSAEPPRRSKPSTIWRHSACTI